MTETTETKECCRCFEIVDETTWIYDDVWDRAFCYGCHAKETRLPNDVIYEMENPR